MKIAPAQFRIKWQVPEEPSARRALEKAKTIFAQKQVAPELDLTFLNLQSLPSTAYELRSLYTPSVASQYERLPKIVHEKLDFLGSGTFGTVHRTVDLHTGDLWAVKTSNYGVDDRRYKRSLKREVEILAALSHVSVHAPSRSTFLMNKQPNIVKFTHSQGWTLGSAVEIIMSLHKGTLMNLISPRKRNHGSMQEPFFCTLLVKHTLEAIAYLHRKGIIHQDIKPQNILYDHNGQNSALIFYVSDFGLSKKQDTASTLEPAGTPIYMAPEVSQGKHTSNSDIWSFAVMMLLVLGYFDLGEPDLPPEELRVRMALLPGYCSDLTFEVDQYPSTSLSSWKNQLRWYGRLRSLVQHEMVPQSLRSLLAEDAETRPNAEKA